MSEADVLFSLFGFLRVLLFGVIVNARRRHDFGSCVV